MNTIPLVQSNEKEAINTSIIAIRKNLEKINEVLGLIDTSDNSTDLSIYVKKADVANVVEENNLNPITSNAVFKNRPSIKKIFDQNATSTSSTYDISESVLNFDYLVCVATMYESWQGMTIIIPKEEVKINPEHMDETYMFNGTISGSATRRITFGFPTETTLKLGNREGTSGHLPIFKAIYGYKLYN